MYINYNDLDAYERLIVRRSQSEWSELGMFATDTAMRLNEIGIEPDQLEDQFENNHLIQPITEEKI
jgi:tRNA (Thr-GGU) A37 N-methylase